MWSDLTSRYSTFFLDLWGVIIDGAQLYPRALEFLQFLRRSESAVVFISNTPTRRADLRKRLDQLGVGAEMYDHIATSGDTVRQFLTTTDHGFGRSFCHLGEKKHGKLLEGLPFIGTTDVEQADFVLLTAAVSENGVGQDLLSRLHRRGLKMLCVNPDLQVVTLDGERIVCPGSTAKWYESIGGTVVYVGKPFPLIFQEAASFTDRFIKADTIMIGDTEETDIAGAAKFGIDSVLVNNTRVTRSAAKMVIENFTT